MSLSKRVTELSLEKRRLLALLMKEKSVGAALLPLAPVERSGNVLPCSFAQQRLWFLDHLEPANVAYIIPPIMVTKANWRKLYTSGFLKKSEICNGSFKKYC